MDASRSRLYLFENTAPASASRQAARMRLVADYYISVGLSGVDKLIEGDPKCVPVVTLGSESYKHAKYGKINNPIFTVVRWVEMPQPGQTAKEAAKPAKKVAAKKAR